MADEDDVAKSPEGDGEKPADQAPDAKAADGGSETSDAEKAPLGDAPIERKKKKKKKKKRAEAKEEAKDEEKKGPALGPEGWERPGFVLDFPKDPELDRLVRAFELGNYAFVREHGKKLAESSSDPGVKSAAGELLRRIEPDPLVRILFSMTIALLLFMVFYAYRSHGH
jgi:hypothetical protein